MTEPTPQDAATTPPPQAPPLAPGTRPTGPNWPLVVAGLALIVGSGLVLSAQRLGMSLTSMAQTGPAMLVRVGLVCAVIGVFGTLARRRRAAVSRRRASRRQ